MNKRKAAEKTKHEAVNTPALKTKSFECGYDAEIQEALSTFTLSGLGTIVPARSCLASQGGGPLGRGMLGVGVVWGENAGRYPLQLPLPLVGAVPGGHCCSVSGVSRWGRGRTLSAGGGGWAGGGGQES